MALLVSVLLLWAVSSVNGDQNMYKVSLEDVKVEYVDKKLVDLHAGLYNFNRTTKAVNLTITLKVNLPEDTKITHRALKWSNNDYRYGVIQMEKRLKNTLDMQSFGVQAICQEYTRPPVVWPLKKNVPYQLIGWVPDSTVFPPNMPEGKWKLVQSIEFANRTKLLVANWFSEVHYKK